MSAMSAGSSVSPGHQHEAHPHGLVRLRQPLRKSQRRVEVAAGELLVFLVAPGLDAQQDHVDGGQLRVTELVAKIAVGLHRGVDAQAFRRREHFTMKRSCISGSPPLKVTPPFMIFSACAYFFSCSVALPTDTGMPLRMVQVSGLWQYRQRHMQPVVQATTRTPGPSTAEPVVNECRKPMSRWPVPSAHPSPSRRRQVHAHVERARGLERGRFRRRGQIRLRGMSG